MERSTEGSTIVFHRLDETTVDRTGVKRGGSNEVLRVHARKKKKQIGGAIYCVG